MLTHEDSFTRENIEAYAAKYLVCPFEMSLDLALFSDVIIGDYNYLFDPHARLQRFFADGTPASDAIFLIDEAHNLLDRGRAMYSADLTRSEILAFRRKIRKLYPALARKLLALSKEFLRIRRAQETAEEEPEPQPPKTGEIHWILDDIDRISERVRETTLEMEEILGKERDPDRRSQKDPNFAAKKALRENFLDFYFRLTHFGMAAGLLDEHYITYAVPSGRDDLLLRLFNVDPSANLRRCMDRGRASILFSATFLPIQYYKELLGGTKEDYEIYAKSVFDARRQGLYVVRDVTSRYARRSEQQYDRIADCILKITGERRRSHGCGGRFTGRVNLHHPPETRHGRGRAGGVSAALLENLQRQEPHRAVYPGRNLLRGNRPSERQSDRCHRRGHRCPAGLYGAGDPEGLLYQKG